MTTLTLQVGVNADDGYSYEAGADFFVNNSALGCDLREGKRLVIVGSGKCYYTDNVFVANPTWVDVSTGLPNVDLFNIKLDPFNYDRAYVLTVDGDLYTNPNLFGGGTWVYLYGRTELVAYYGAITNHYLSTVDLSPSSDGFIACGLNRRGPDSDVYGKKWHSAVAHSHDGGATWSYLEGVSTGYGSPFSPRWTGTVVGQRNHNYIYHIYLFGSAVTGLLVSEDGGDSWARWVDLSTLTHNWGGLLAIPYAANDDRVIYDFLNGTVGLAKTAKSTDAFVSHSDINNVAIPRKLFNYSPFYGYIPVRFDPTDINYIYNISSIVNTFGYSSDSGANWTTIPLEDVNDYAFAHELFSSAGVVRNYVGVYNDPNWYIEMTTDLSTWTVASAAWAITDMILDPRY